MVDAFKHAWRGYKSYAWGKVREERAAYFVIILHVEYRMWYKFAFAAILGSSEADLEDLPHVVRPGADSGG